MIKASYSYHIWDKPINWLTPGTFQKMLQQNDNEGIVDAIRNGYVDIHAKRWLPQVNWQCSFTTKTRSAKGAILNLVYVVDWDHANEDLHKFYEEKIKPCIKELKLFMVQISASGNGLHIGGYFRDDLGLCTREDNVKYLSKQLGFPYDRNCIDAERCWFVTKTEDFLYFDYSFFNE